MAPKRNRILHQPAKAVRPSVSAKALVQRTEITVPPERVLAQTGTGKTAGFTLPILHRAKLLRSLEREDNRKLEAYATWGKLPACRLPLSDDSSYGQCTCSVTR